MSPRKAEVGTKKNVFLMGQDSRAVRETEDTAGHNHSGKTEKPSETGASKEMRNPLQPFRDGDIDAERAPNWSLDNASGSQRNACAI